MQTQYVVNTAKVESKLSNAVEGLVLRMCPIDHFFMPNEVVNEVNYFARIHPEEMDQTMSDARARQRVVEDTLKNLVEKKFLKLIPGAVAVGWIQRLP